MQSHRDHRAPHPKLFLPRVPDVDLGPTTGNQWSWLAQLPCLTSLRVQDSGDIEGHTIVPSILASCPKLTHFDVDSPSLYLSDFVRAFASPVMRQLHSLTIRNYFGGLEWERRVAPSDEERTAAFAGMSCLHSLTLVSITDIDPLLPFLAHAPVLAPLTILLEDQWTDGSCPSVDALQQLLTAAPTLHCTLRGNGLIAAEPELEARLKQFGSRMRVCSDR